MMIHALKLYQLAWQVTRVSLLCFRDGGEGVVDGLAQAQDGRLQNTEPVSKVCLKGFDLSVFFNSNMTFGTTRTPSDHILF